MNCILEVMDWWHAGETGWKCALFWKTWIGGTLGKLAGKYTVMEDLDPDRAIRTLTPLKWLELM